ncbi:ABCC4 (predicted) [Pycnogonum litorale]
MVCTRAAKKLHDIMFNRMLHVPMHFFNINPIGRILNRFAKDVGNVDDRLPPVVMSFMNSIAKHIVVIVVVCLQNYYLIFVFVLMVLLFLPISYLYFPTYQALKANRQQYQKSNIQSSKYLFGRSDIDSRFQRNSNF